MTQQKLLFHFNRFSANEVMAKWEKADKSKDVVVLESETSDWSVQVDGFHSISHQVFETFLSKMDEFDNEVQFFCKEAYEKSNYSIENYLVTLEWISVLENSITMGYWGNHV